MQDYRNDRNRAGGTGNERDRGRGNREMERGGREMERGGREMERGGREMDFKRVR